MRNIVVLIKNNLKVAILVKPFKFILSLLAPFLILLVFIKFLSVGGGYIKVGVIDEDNSISSTSIVNELKEYSGFSIINIKEDQIEELFSSREIEIVVKINNEFEENILKLENNKSIDIYAVSGDDSLNIIKNIIDSEIKSFKELSYSVKEDRKLYYNSLEEYLYKKENTIRKMSLNDLYGDYFNSRIFIGFIILSMLLKGLKHSYRIFVEKEDFIYNRIFMAPVKTYEYYVADILSGFIDISIQIVLTIIGIRLLNINIGLTNLILALILSLVGLVGLSLCICLRTFTKNTNELANIYNFIYIVLVMLGGSFIPLEMLPDIINKISYFNPIRWAVESISKMQQGGTLKDIRLNILVLSLFTLVFLVIGIYRTRKEEKSNLIL